MCPIGFTIARFTEVACSVLIAFGLALAQVSGDGLIIQYSQQLGIQITAGYGIYIYIIYIYYIYILGIYIYTYYIYILYIYIRRERERERERTLQWQLRRYGTSTMSVDRTRETQRKIYSMTSLADTISEDGTSSPWDGQKPQTWG